MQKRKESKNNSAFQNAKYRGVNESQTQYEYYEKSSFLDIPTFLSQEMYKAKRYTVDKSREGFLSYQ